MSRVSPRLKAFGFAMVAAIVAGATGAQTQGVINMPKVSAEVANILVGESVASCKAKNYSVTAVVVDLDGVRQAVLRGDGAPIHTVDNAFYKAYSSASITLGRKEGSTKVVADRMAKNPPSSVPTTPLPNITYAQGGVAIMAGERIIGGLGVSGAPGGQFDEECARAALGKVADKLK
jgi:uncharacterized protein GlcG (DUF336 family)